MDVITIAKKLIALSGHKLAIHAKNPGLSPEYSGNNDRLRRLIPDMRWTPIDSAVNDLYAWYRRRDEAVDLKRLAMDF